MSLSRVVARPMLAAMFISGGLDAARHPETKVEAAKPVTDQLRTVIPSLPEDTATLVRVNGVVQVGAGVLLAVGKFRRVAALALIGSVIPTTWAGHRFWEESDEQKRAQQRVHFFKNVGLLGGLILAMVDTEGAPSLGWRAKRGAHQISHVVSLGGASTNAGIHHTSAKAAALGHNAGRRATKAARKANKAAVRGGQRANQLVAGAATSGIGHAAPYVRQVNESAHHVVKAALDSAEDGASRAAARATASGHHAGRKARKMTARANKAARRGGHRAGQNANRVIADAAASGVALAAPYLRHANESAHSVVEGAQSVAHALREGAEPALTALREGVDPLLAAGAERAEELRDKVSEHFGS
jgi:uncharacterized membrane protein YphA (DoxX/SURF4 family)